MNDVLPESSYSWQYIESIFARCLTSYGYSEIRLPLLESTNLFKRTIGEVTDIVEKEMYTFNDLNQESISLRPEGTAGCVRACLEHGLLHNKQQKLWYLGPMFRHEKPQKGRYRQFNQLGVEAFGIAGVGIEIELILLCKKIWCELGIDKNVELQINTLGDLEERKAYRELLVEYFKPKIELLDEESKKRLDKNPLRILDSKNPKLQDLISSAPKLIDNIKESSQQHFKDLCAGLDLLEVKYSVNPCLVRGLDYYGHTVFEWVTDKLGSQATVCAGGRYNKLIEQLGGRETPAVGFALGVERILLLMQAIDESPKPTSPDVYLIADNQQALLCGFKIAEILRETFELNVIVNLGAEKFKNQFKKADKSGARLALILGEEEVNNNSVGIKDLRQSVDQKTIKQEELSSFIKDYFVGDK
ncbi:MAG: histidine--tRNA ligase [Legionellaceae bacterium]|nr:histidine--tRNA ligase [Legionellaceae bacterium]